MGEQVSRKFRWDGRRIRGALMESQGATSKEIAEYCFVTVETVYTWQNHPEWRRRVDHYVELQVANFVMRDKTAKELELAMVPVIKFLRRVVDEGIDGVTAADRISLAFRMLDRGGVRDPEPVTPVAGQGSSQPGAAPLQILVDQRQQIMAPGDAALAAELERFRTPPVDIPLLPGTNGAQPDS